VGHEWNLRHSIVNVSMNDVGPSVYILFNKNLSSSSVLYSFDPSTAPSPYASFAKSPYD
jgi:hypothetical protein